MVWGGMGGVGGGVLLIERLNPCPDVRRHTLLPNVDGIDSL